MLFKTPLWALSLAALAQGTAIPQSQLTKAPPAGTTSSTAAWMFANATTADATPDGEVGVIIEPDLVVGKPSGPGLTVSKTRFGAVTLRPKAMAMQMVMTAPKPCGNCYITAMQVGLEYADGTIANVDTGSWLHHIDLSVSGQETDYVCGAMAPVAFGGRRIYAAGNERVPVRFNTNEKYGIAIGSGGFRFQSELMSVSSTPKTVYMTMTYEWISKAQATGYKPVYNAWMDVTGCGISDFPAKSGVYSAKSPSWKSTVDAKFLFATGHLHDGGVDVLLMKNGKQICRAKSLYANRRGGYYERAENGMGAEMTPQNGHISDTAVCKDFGTLKKDDTLMVVANYDGITHPQMKKGGRLEAQMGISQVYMGAL